MKRSKVLPLILITAAAVTGIGVAGFFAIRKYNDLRAGKTLGKIISECPFDQPSGIAWQYIPSDNIAGFAAVGRYSSKYYDLDILVFENGKATDGIDYIIRNYDFADDRMPHYMFSIDEKKISNEEHYTYFFLKNEPDEYYSVDKVSFYKDGVNVTVDYIDDMSITYRKEDEPNRLLTYKHQVFDSGKNRWVMTDDSVTVIETEVAGIQFCSWEEPALEKDAPEPFHFQSGVGVGVDYYNFTRDVRNDFTGTYEPRTTSIGIIISSDIELFGGGFTNEEIVLDNEEFKLFMRLEDNYVDITPEDVSVEVNHWESGKTVTVVITSGELAAPEVGEYRIEFGQYNVDFEITMQQFEVW